MYEAIDEFLSTLPEKQAKETDKVGAIGIAIGFIAGAIAGSCLVDAYLIEPFFRESSGLPEYLRYIADFGAAMPSAYLGSMLGGFGSVWFKLRHNKMEENKSKNTIDDTVV